MDHVAFWLLSLTLGKAPEPDTEDNAPKSQEGVTIILA